MIGSVSSGKNLNVKPVKVSNLNHDKCMTKNKHLSLKKANIRRTCRIMRVFLLFFMLGMSVCFSNNTYSQSTKISLNLKNKTVKQVFSEIEKNSEFIFFYQDDVLDASRKVTVNTDNATIEQILNEVLNATGNTYFVSDRSIYIIKEALDNIVHEEDVVQQQKRQITGIVTDKDGEAIIGANIVEKGTTNGTVTNIDGRFSLNVESDAAILISYIGYLMQEINIVGKTAIDVVLQEDTQALDELVVVGYGTMRKSDLTGSVVRADFEKFRDQPNISILQSLHGSVAGLNVSQITEAGSNPSFSIRGRTSISGEQQPLIIVDGVIFRGNLIDLNPDDVDQIDILKDNSAAAVYGSQAANGVIIITSKSGEGKNMKPLINYSASYSFQSPTVEFIPGNGDDFIKKNTEIDWRQSRTPESGYLEPRPDYNVSATFKTNEQLENYLNGRETNWYNLLTNDHIYVNNHNLSLSNRTEYLNYFISFGYTDQQGYMINEKYKRYNARINVDNKLTDWLTIGVQTFGSISDNSGMVPSTSDRYLMPFEAAYTEDGKLNPLIEGRSVSPLVEAEADNLDKRYNIFGNLYAAIDFPFLKGLSYKFNFSNNLRTTRNYYFQPYSNNFQGMGQKSYSYLHDMSSDNILSFKRRFNRIHNFDITLLYGFEKRKNDYTDAKSSVFINDILGYNSLQSGSSDLQETFSGAWKEKSLYSMARLFYSLYDKYMITATVRRDGFSGFSENNKFGFFPSLALGWVASEETFFENFLDVMNYLKIRGSYGSIGNRTVGRYQTLAKVDGGFRYVNSSGTPVYTKSISDLASPNLKWETTTGLNLGVDFGFFDSRISGQIEYYNNNTRDLLYSVDIPSIGRFSKFPDNLGKIHNHGIEITLSTINIKKNNFSWTSDFTFSRNRDELKELLGFDNDGDGKEDDLISEGLFIGHPLSTIYDYQVTGKLYQIGDDIPATADIGSQEIVDQNNDGKIDPENDKIILGYGEPSYRFSISNQFTYKNWSLSFFINSVQGGKDYYYARDNIHYQTLGSGFSNSEDVYGQHYQLNFPKGIDYWLPENPNARYPRVGTAISKNLLATSYAQRNFVRLQDVSLSYTVRKQHLNKFNLENLRLFISGKNLYTWTKWPGWDPETGSGISRNGRPVLKSWTLGLNLEF